MVYIEPDGATMPLDGESDQCYDEYYDVQYEDVEDRTSHVGEKVGQA